MKVTLNTCPVWETLKGFSVCLSVCLSVYLSLSASVSVSLSLLIHACCFNVDTQLSCPSPKTPLDALPLNHTQTSYPFGQEVVFQCASSAEFVSTRCLSDGTWSPFGYACGGLYVQTVRLFSVPDVSHLLSRPSSHCVSVSLK